MSGRFSAARPKRAAETFARAHHGQDAANGQSSSTTTTGPSSKKVKFDVRNPSALAPSALGDDDDDDLDADDAAVLEADVIGKGAGGTKRGAVNIDGYDSDSENETFKDRAAARKSQARNKSKGAGAGAENDQDVGDVEIDIADQLDNYEKNLKSGGVNQDDEDEDEDMFGGADDDADETTTTTRAKKNKDVRFLDADQIEGQEQESKSGGIVKLFEEHSESSDDEEDRELAIQEEGVDEEVGMGGLKKNAPKIDAFNMKDEQQEGAFDESGNFIRKAADPDAMHDRWLEGVSKKEMKRAAEAHEKREAEKRRARKEDDAVATEDLLKRLILSIDKGETPIEALARLGKGRAKEKKVPKWKLKKLEKKQGEGDAMDVDQAKETEDPAQVKIKEGINAITEAADKLLGREFTDVYETEREKLIRDWQTEAGERWTEPSAVQGEAAGSDATSSGKMWQYRWIDGRDGESIQGPYDGPTMKAWQDAGYFDGVEFRAIGEDEWDRIAAFE